MRSKIYIYIILVLLITANILHKLVYTQSMKIGAFTKNIRSCGVEGVGWRLEVPKCEQYQELEFVEISSRVVGDSDNSFFQPKRLIAQAVTEKYIGRVSGKRWWESAQNYIVAGRNFLLKHGLSFLPGDQAGLVAGMVFGGSQDLSQELQTAFQVAGLTHVVSASGYNVSVISGMIIWLTSFILPRALPKRFSVWLIILGVWAYAIVAELVPPVIRAAIMISLSILSSQVFYRQQNTLFTWGTTVAIMLALEPFYMVSLSFWLSALATLGIIVFLPLLVSAEGIFYQLETGQVVDQFAVQKKRKTEAGPWLWLVLRESLLVTLAAQAFTTPLILLVFGKTSYLSVVTNTLLLWLTPIITLMGLGLMLVGAALAVFSAQAPVQIQVQTQAQTQWLMIFLSRVVSWPVKLFIDSVKWFGQFEWGVVKWSLSWQGVFLWWLVLLVLLGGYHYFLRKKKIGIEKERTAFL